jgi:hypothetical protein
MFSGSSTVILRLQPNSPGGKIMLSKSDVLVSVIRLTPVCLSRPLGWHRSNFGQAVTDHTLARFETVQCQVY